MTSPRSRATPPTNAPLRAWVAVPLIKGGCLVATLGLYHRRPRHWTAEEIALLEDTAERTWAAVERARAEAALRASEERLRRMVSIEGVGILVFDRDGTLLDANDFFLALTGYTREQVAARTLTWRDMTPPEYVAVSEEQLGRLWETGRIGPYEKEYLRADGTRTWMLFAGADLGDGTVVEYCLDITDRKRAEAAREAFVEAAAHDLRTPLTALKGQAQLLRRRVAHGAEPAAFEPGLAAIAAAAGRMVALIDEMLDAARLRGGQALELHVGPTDLVALVQAAAKEIRRNTSRHDVRVEAAVPMLVGEWDEARLDRVLGNLLSNAVKFSPAGGEVVVRVAQEADAAGAWAVVSVRDHGVGIPAADLPHPFERFHRGSNVGAIGGTGLGLAGAKRIVEQHGGTIAVESVEGEGTTVTVRLPLRADGE